MVGSEADKEKSAQQGLEGSDFKKEEECHGKGGWRLIKDYKR